MTESFGLVEVRAPYYHGSTLISRFYDDVRAASEGSKGREFGWGDVESRWTPGKVKPAHSALAGAREKINCLELARSRRPLGWSSAQVSEAVLVGCGWCVMEKRTQPNAAHKAVDISTGLKFLAGWSEWDEAQTPIEDGALRLRERKIWGNGNDRLKWRRGGWNRSRRG